MNSIDAIMDLSGPFMDERARKKHRNWLEGLSEKKRAERLQALQESDGREPLPRRRTDPIGGLGRQHVSVTAVPIKRNG